jgi:O-antigen/teichoic acid export membrane protein
MNLSSKVSKALGYNAFGMILSTINTVIYSIIVVRWLQLQKIGGYAFLDSIFSTLAILYTLGTHSTIMRYIPELIAKREYPRLRTLVFKLQTINIISSLTATFVILISADIFLMALGKPELAFYARLWALDIIFLAVLGITDRMLVAVYEQKFLSIFDTFFSFLRLLFLIMFVWILHMELTGVIMASLINDIIAAIVYSIYIRRKHTYLFKGEKAIIDSSYYRRLVRYATPLIGLNLVSEFSGYAGNIFLGALRNLEELAYFDISKSFANRIFSQIWSLTGSIGIVSLTEASSDMSKFKLALRQYTKIISLYAFPITIGGIIIAEPLLIMFYGEKVLPSVEIFRILLPAYCFINILGMSSIILNVSEKTYLLLLGDTFRSLMTIVFSLWLIPTSGINGAILSTILPSIIVTTYYAYFVTAKLGMGNFVPLKTIGKYLASSLFMGAIVAFITNFLYTNRVWTLISSLIIGPPVYALALRFVRAFDQTDKRMFMGMKVPFKSIILKLLWKE